MSWSARYRPCRVRSLYVAARGGGGGFGRTCAIVRARAASLFGREVADTDTYTIWYLVQTRGVAAYSP